MKDYHFEIDNQDFGQTVRLDIINEKVKQLKNNSAEDELGDANDFLKAFESEKFDTPVEDFEEEEESVEDTIRPVQNTFVPKKAAPIPAEEEEWEEYDEEERFGGSKKTVALIAVLAVLACIIGFSLVRCGFQPGAAPSKPSGDAYPMLVEGVLDGEELVVYDITEEERKTLLFTEDTERIF